MWLENLKELKKSKGLTTKQLADATKLPESTIKRIFSGETDNPYVDTLRRIATALGSSLDEIFAETNMVLSPESIVEVKEVVEEVEAERDSLLSEYEELLKKAIAQETEIRLLREELTRTEARHKDDLLALVKYFTNIKPTD